MELLYFKTTYGRIHASQEITTIIKMSSPDPTGAKWVGANITIQMKAAERCFTVVIAVVFVKLKTLFLCPEEDNKYYSCPRVYLLSVDFVSVSALVSIVSSFFCLVSFTAKETYQEFNV